MCMPHVAAAAPAAADSAQVHGLCLAASLFAQEGVSGLCRGAAPSLEPEVHATLSHALQFVAAQQQLEGDAQTGGGEARVSMGSSWDELPCFRTIPDSADAAVHRNDGATQAQPDQLGRVHAQGLGYLPPGVCARARVRSCVCCVLVCMYARRLVPVPVLFWPAWAHACGACVRACVSVGASGT